MSLQFFNEDPCTKSTLSLHGKVTESCAVSESTADYLYGGPLLVGRFVFRSRCAGFGILQI